jgi:hypothetical protein
MDIYVNVYVNATAAYAKQEIIIVQYDIISVIY